MQTRRHTYLASLVGMPHIVLAVNKMDMVDYSQARFDEIVAEYLKFAAQLDLHDVTCIPHVRAERRHGGGSRRQSGLV